MSRVHNRALSAAELQSFGDELDAIRARVQRQVGAPMRATSAASWLPCAGAVGLVVRCCSLARSSVAC